MLKKSLSIVFIFTFVLCFIGTGFGAEKVTWKLAGMHAVNTPETKGLNYFAKLVKERSNGNFAINVYPAGQLGKDQPSLVENIVMGSIEMFASVMDWNSGLVKDFGILAMPFLFKDLKAVKEFQKRTLYEEMKERMIKEHGVRVLSDNWYRLPKVLLAKKPVRNLGDLKGLKVRMPSIKTYFETWKYLGAKPTVIPWAEAFLALKKGVVDGMDSPLGSVYGMKFHQAAPFIMMTNHLIAPFDILICEKKYQQLPESYRKILVEAGKEGGGYYTEQVEEMFKVDKKKMIKEGVKFLEIDTGPFAQKAAELAARFEAEGMWKKGLFEQILESQGK
jgi:tripartite ATP-independent transporter DctP family solute receptor